MPRHSRLNRPTPAAAARSLRLEPLEDRRVLSVTLEMLTDVGSTPHSGDSNPSGFVQVGDLTYFSTKQGTQPASTTEIWVTNGTTNATRLLSDFMPQNLLVGGVVGEVAGKFYFSASDSGSSGYRLWQWEGIGSEPTPVLSAAGNRVRSWTPLVAVDGVWYFGGQSESEGPELWRTDGTPAGTYLVKEIRSGTQGGLQPPSNAPHQSTLFNVGGTLMFIANDGTHGSELWTSDGTEAGTFMVKDVFAGDSSGVYGGSSNGRMAAVVGNVLYFSATEPAINAELWRSDGTEAGTYRVKDIRPGSLGSTPQHLTNVGGVLYFAANDGASGNELWKSDGTETGTVLVKNLNSNSLGMNLFDLTEMNGVLYFGAESLGSAWLWRSDGTTEGTTAVLDGHQSLVYLRAPVGSLGQSYGNLDNIVNLKGTLFFPGRLGSTADFALWKFDGFAGATPVHGYYALPSGDRSRTFSTLNFLTVAGDKLYFAGDSSHHGNEPWISDGTTDGTRFLKDVTGISANSVSGGVTNLNGTLIFLAAAGVHQATPPVSWWSTDGTIAGTTSYAPANGFTMGNSTSSSSAVVGSGGGILYYKVQGTTSLDWDLWRTDGTPDGTFRVKKMRSSGAIGSSIITNISAEMNGDLYFFANDVAHGLELWRSDGTEVGTTLVVDINPGAFHGVQNSAFANVDGTLFFVANDGVNGHAIWKSDGTAAGTSLVRSFNDKVPSNLLNVNGTLYFAAENAEAGFELWRSDGTANGTTLVKDLSPGDSLARINPSFQPFANIGDTIYFIANDGATGFELWKSDGTSEGTLVVRDINPIGSGLSTTGLSQFTVVDHTLYFYANDGVHGMELWKSDGTEAGTALVKDLRPGASSSISFPRVQQTANVGGILYFASQGAGYSVDLWRTDGTETGTYRVQSLGDSQSIIASTGAGSLTNVNGRLYYLADGGTYGMELWVLSPDPSAMAAGDYDQNGVTDGADFLKWQRAFGMRDVTNDGDGDGVVGLGDLEAWKQSFGTPVSAAAVSDRAAVAALVAEEEENVEAPAFGGEPQAAIGGDERQASRRETAARDALFAAGDLSHFFAAGEDDFAEASWRRRRDIRGR